MAAVSRQPFAPLDDARIQSLTSLKNRQNAISSTPPSQKRKADSIEFDNSENVDPLFFAKRSKGANSGTPSKDILKSPSFVLTKAAATPLPDARVLASPTRPATSSAARRTLQPKSPAAKLNTSIIRSSPISAPAGRSPTRGKRSGLLSTRRRSGPFTRVDPPSFNLGSSGAAPFSLDAALKGTIPGYGDRPKARTADPLAGLHEPEMKANWFFDIHEDTPEQEMTNLLQHGTCVLDISSDEETQLKAKRDKDEGRDKENVPPVDDVSQTSARSAPRLRNDDMIIEKERVALGEMNTADYFAEGCDESSVIIVPGDEDEQPATKAEAPQPAQHAPIVEDFEFAPELKTAAETQETVEQVEEIQTQEDIDVLMNKSDDSSSKAAVLQPMEGTGESFDLWESGSTKDETEAAAAAASS